MSRLSCVVLAVLALVVVPLAGCGSTGGPAEASGSLRVVDATVDVPPNPEQASLRFVIDNRSGRADELLSVSSRVAGAADVHRSEVDDQGVATMDAVDRLPIPPRSRVTFEPGGLHVMLRQFDQPLEVGQTFEVDLSFAEAGTRTVEVRVVEPATAPTAEPNDAIGASGSMDDMEHDDDAY